MTVLDKKQIRKYMKQKRLLYDKQTLLSYSHQIINQIYQHPKYIESSLIGIYVSLELEVYTLDLIKNTLKTKRVAVPKVVGETMEFYEIKNLEDLKEGHFHVLEPTTQTIVQPSDIELMITPMLAFDELNYRVGYGKGYYDRYFSNGFKGYKLGLAYDFSYVKNITCDKYDIKLDEVITNATL